MYSQAEEDEILASLLTQQAITHGLFVEIGVGYGAQNNTLALAHRGWSGYWFGDEPIRVAIPPTITFVQATVTSDNVFDLCALVDLAPRPPSPPITVFSLDIDGNDYWVGDVVIPHLQPAIVIVEYCATAPPGYIMPNTPNYRWQPGMPHGCALDVWQTRLAADYDFVATTIAKVNAFFVRRA